VQPLIAPLYGGKTPAHVLAALDGRPEADAHEMVRESWRRRVGMKGFEHFWDAALQRGVISGTAAAVVEPQVAWSRVAALVDVPPASAAARSDALELAVVQDPRVYDGSFANNPWLQELPDPATKLTWDNAALLAPSTAHRLGVTTGDMVDLDAGGRGLRAAVQLLPGLAEQLVALGMGYGRSAPEEPVAHGRGFDGFRLTDAATS